MPRLPLGTYDGKLREGRFVDVRNLRGGIITAQTIILAGGTNGAIRSQNYDGTDGWAIFGDGSAFFGGDVVLGADLYSSNWESGGGTLPANLATRDTGATAGYYLDLSTGVAQFVKIYADTGELLDLDITGTLTMGAAGLIRTAATGARVEIQDGGFGGSVRFFTAGGETNTPEVVSEGVVGPPQTTSLHLKSGYPSADVDDESSIVLFSKNTSTDSSISVVTETVNFYLGDADKLLRFVISTAGVQVRGTDRILTVDELGSAGVPAIGIGALHNEGMYSSGVASLNWSIAGTEALQLLPTGLLIKPAYANNNVVLGLDIERAWNFKQRNTGSITHLDLESTSNKNFYVRSVTNGDIALFAGGAVSGSRFYVDRNVTDVGNVNTLRIARGAAGTLAPIGYYSSWIKDPDTGKTRKKYVVELGRANKHWNREWFLDLKPIKYERAQGDGKERSVWDHPQVEMGFSIENLIEHTNLLTSNGDAVGDSPDEMALLAVVVDYVQSLEKRVAALEAQLS